MARTSQFGAFEWDSEKELRNIKKHGLSFSEAIESFLDKYRIIAIDEIHSKVEPRYFCIGKIGSKVSTVRFTMRGNKIRILGAGFWRKGRTLYEKTRKDK